MLKTRCRVLRRKPISKLSLASAILLSLADELLAHYEEILQETPLAIKMRRWEPPITFYFSYFSNPMHILFSLVITLITLPIFAHKIVTYKNNSCDAIWVYSKSQSKNAIANLCLSSIFFCSTNIGQILFKFLKTEWFPWLKRIDVLKEPVGLGYGTMCNPPNKWLWKEEKKGVNGRWLQEYVREK